MSEPFGDRAEEVPGLLRAVRVLRERWWLIAAAALLCCVVALGLSLRATKQYSASSKLYFPLSTLAEQLGGQSQAPVIDPESQKATNVLLVTTNQVAEAVRRRMSSTDSAADLLAQVTVASVEASDVVEITATDPDPERAAKIANTWAVAYVSESKNRAQALVRSGEELLVQRRNELAPTDTAGREQFDTQIGTFQRAEALQVGDAEVVDQAPIPTVAVSPNPKRDAAVALLLGSALGIGLAFLLNVMDRRLKSIDDFEAIYRVRALAGVPLQGKVPTTVRERSAALEPFRILRSGIAGLDTSRDIRVVMVTSAVAGEGKSTAAAGLARAIALAGQTVALVEVDLRRPTFHQQFELKDNRGLSTALVSGANAAEMLREALPGLPTFKVLPSGPVPPNGGELLRSAAMVRVLAELRGAVDYVVLDAPPLLPVADAQSLLDQPEIDAVLIVGRAFKTARDEARRTRAIFDRHTQGRIGLVVNGLRALDSGYDYYAADPPPGKGGRGGRRTPKAPKEPRVSKNGGNGAAKANGGAPPAKTGRSKPRIGRTSKS